MNNNCRPGIRPRVLAQHIRKHLHKSRPLAVRCALSDAIDQDLTDLCQIPCSLVDVDTLV